MSALLHWSREEILSMPVVEFLAEYKGAYNDYISERAQSAKPISVHGDPMNRAQRRAAARRR